MNLVFYSTENISESIVYDIVYQPMNTDLIKKCKRKRGNYNLWL